MILTSRPRTAALLAIGIAFLAAVAAPRSAIAQQPSEFVGGQPVPGISLAAYSGGPVATLPAAAPRAESFWTTIDGRMVGYLVNSPEFVNREFIDHFSEGIPAGTPMLVVTPLSALVSSPDPDCPQWPNDAQATIRQDGRAEAVYQNILEEEQRGCFEGLVYYPRNDSYRITATPELVDATEQATPVYIPTSGTHLAEFLPWARVSFTINGQDVWLMIVQRPQDQSLFLSFRDATSGVTTYGGGRYLGVWRLDNGDVSFDLNSAYNPPCAYNANWICPLVHPENHLAVAVTAGERAYPDPR